MGKENVVYTSPPTRSMQEQRRYNYRMKEWVPKLARWSHLHCSQTSILRCCTRGAICTVQSLPQNDGIPCLLSPDGRMRQLLAWLSKQKGLHVPRATTKCWDLPWGAAAGACSLLIQHNGKKYGPLPSSPSGSGAERGGPSNSP